MSAEYKVINLSRSNKLSGDGEGWWWWGWGLHVVSTLYPLFDHGAGPLTAPPSSAASH